MRGATSTAGPHVTVDDAPRGPGRTVWLASYPKSGNTWLRAIVTALDTHRHLFGVNHLGSGSQPFLVDGTLSEFGLDPRWLSAEEVDRMRTVLAGRWSRTPEGWDESHDPPPVLRKTHEVYRMGAPGREPFPVQATRAAILIVRDPRDVACSYAPFFGVSLGEAVDALGRDAPTPIASPANSRTAQPWGSWSSHAESWLPGDLPFPVHLVRYEDLIVDATAVLHPVFESIGLTCSTDELQAAVHLTEFQRLQESEEQRGFRETSKRTERFFRRGLAGVWREELVDAQIAAIESDHGPVMQRLGYPLTTTTAQRAALSESRASRRRAARHGWMRLPDSMGLTVLHSEVPDEIDRAQRPRPFIQVNDHQALVSFAAGARLLVEDGERITVTWTPDPENPDADPSWLVQGWGVTIAMLQRGVLSLHAATVCIGDEVIAIAGRRGAGKSTTAMALRSRGHALLVDDVTLVEFRSGQAWTTPYSRNVHLLPDAAEALGLDFDALPMLAGGRSKVAFRAEEPPEQPRRIDRIVILESGLDDKLVTVEDVRGGERLAALLAHTRRDGVAPLVLGQKRYFELMTKLSDAVPVFVLRRPREVWTLDEVLDRIEGLSPASPAAGPAAHR